MTCPHGISAGDTLTVRTIPEDGWVVSGAFRVAVCLCCGRPFMPLPGFEAERCSYCLVVVESGQGGLL